MVLDPGGGRWWCVGSVVVLELEDIGAARGKVEKNGRARKRRATERRVVKDVCILTMMIKMMKI